MTAEAAYRNIRYRRDGAVVTVTLARPRVRNAVDPPTARELARAWQTFRDDPKAHVGILAGDGPVFCAGADLKAFPPHVARMTDADLRREEWSGLGYLGYTRGTDVTKPTLAAIEGGAFAGGLEWGLWCDLRVCGASAEFGILNRRWNIGLADGGTQRLWRTIGMGRAMELMLTGRRIDARTALAWGLVNRVVPDGKALVEAKTWAREIAALPQESIRADKEALLKGIGTPLSEALRTETRLFHDVVRQGALGSRLAGFHERTHPDLHPRAKARARMK